MKISKSLIVGYLNINSLRNKFELLKPFIYNALYIFLVLETKMNSSFPNSPLETGISDFHKLTAFSLKSHILKAFLKRIIRY